MEYLEHLLLLGVDSVIVIVCYHQYQKVKTVYSEFINAQNLGVNPACSSKQELDGKVVVLQGAVKAVNQPIKSVNSSAKGVIQKLTIREHALTRSTYGYWNDRERIVDEKYNVVPFKLHTTSYDVKITCPFEADYLTLDVVEDKFEPSFSNFVSRLLGYLVGFHQQGFQYTEYLLKEDTILTGLGELSVNSKGELQLQPTSNKTVYVLTTLEPSVFVKKLNSESSRYKWLLIISICAAAVIVTFMIRKWWLIKRMRKMWNEVIFNRKKSVPRDNHGEPITCIICLDKAREVLILPCGHVCLCLDCVSQISDCPICRRRIINKIPAFIS